MVYDQTQMPGVAIYCIYTLVGIAFLLLTRTFMRNSGVVPAMMMLRRARTQDQGQELYETMKKHRFSFGSSRRASEVEGDEHLPVTVGAESMAAVAADDASSVDYIAQPEEM